MRSCLIFVLLLLPAFAMADVFDHPVTDASSIDIYAPERLSGDFEQIKNITTLGVQLVSKGEFAINNNGIMWKNTTPLQNTTIIEKDRICTIANGQQKVIEGSGPLEEVLNVLSATFTQDYAALSRYFELFYEPNTIGMRAKDGVIASVIKEMSIETSKYINKISFSDVNGDVTTITFSNISESAPEFGCD